MIVGSYRSLVLPFDEMPVIFDLADRTPYIKTSEDVFVTDIDGLTDFTHTYDSHTGNVFVGIVSRAYGVMANVDLQATYGGLPMTRVAFSKPGSGAYGFAIALFGIKGGPTGPAELKISNSGAGVNVGFAALKISNANSLAEDWNVGASAYSTFDNGMSASGVVSANIGIEGDSTGLTYLCFGGVDQYEAYPVEIISRNISEGETRRYTIEPEAFGRELFPGIVPDTKFTNSFSFGRRIMGPESTDGVCDGTIRFRGVNANLYGVCCAVIRGNFES
uniref:Tail fiber protein n=1 Tax=Rhizobium phage LG08 TaxID=3129229 RepID=A0AAU8HYF7_9CAUD